jgi:hypothetical protein
MILNYKKRKNTELFDSFKKIKELSLYNTQNYIPIYSRFFSLNHTNYNNINLNHNNYVDKILSYNDYNNSYDVLIVNDKNNSKVKKQIFIKLAPLLDPYKFLSGKYDIPDESMFNIPTIDDYKIIKEKSIVYNKINEINNSSYVEGFFYYLSSVLFNKHNFINGIDFYGSFLSIKNNFIINVEDDIEYLACSKFFIKHKNNLFFVDDYSKIIIEDENNSNISKNKFKNPIIIHNCDILSNNITLDNEIEILQSFENSSQSLEITDINELNVLEKTDNLTTTIKSFSSSSSCSSRTSYTNSDENSKNQDCDYEIFEGIDFLEDIEILGGIEKLEGIKNLEDIKNLENIKMFEDIENFEDTENIKCIKNLEKNDESSENDEDNNYEDIDDEDEDENDDEDEDEEEQEEIKATIPKFPVQVICIENCENTLDYLLSNDKIEIKEMTSIFMQIIMTLLTYQKAFYLTHNDLHTNNVMYNTTNKKFIYYCYNNIYYKVETFGKIFKIIDFNRSIYKYNNEIFCSDSFKIGGDAATQYNTEPFFDERKPRLEPNFSFDLCRLGCSIFDYLVDDLSKIKNIEKCDSITQLVVEWCSDDKGINILYKNDGTERYPDFKLYKMISRIVHKHTPENQLKKDIFKQLIINKKNINKKESIINIDNIPKYY